MAFCLAAEEFVDDKLSNWYIRRNRDRFWSVNDKLSEADKKDKLAAYQTLHKVLVDLTRLIAPVAPFLAETMWDQLKVYGRPSVGTDSVHLHPFPESNESLIDDELSVEMNALLRLVSLGLSVRKTADVKVRQPLSEFNVFTTNDAERRTVKRFADQFLDELNVKRVSLADSPLLTASAKLNKKTAAAKLGPNLKKAETELAALDATKLGGTVTLAGVELNAADYVVEFTAPAGFAGTAEKGTQVVFDTTITPELKAEGLARDVVRVVQDARKDAGLDVADKIALYLGASLGLARAIETHRATIAGEAQVVEWLTAIPAGGFATTAKVDGAALEVGVRKV